MSEYLRLTHNLLISLGGVPSPETFPIPDSAVFSQTVSPSMLKQKAGEKKFEPTSFVFFQGSLVRAFILGHIPQDNGPTLPVLYAIIASGVLSRHNGEMRPYFPPSVREIVIVPDGIKGSKEIIASHVESGLEVELYKTDNSYLGIQKNASDRIISLFSDIKERVFLEFSENVEGDEYFILIDGSLKPTEQVLKHSNWVGIYTNPPLSQQEERVSLTLGENEIGPPFTLQNDGSGFFWHLRMNSDLRKGPGWGLVRVENVLGNKQDMETKISALSAGILAEKYPLHPLSEKENGRLYPLITARVFLKTQTTDDTSIMKYF
jgi:hypothetical protein